MSTLPPRSELTTDLLARCRFPSPGTSVVCAVSGGADSTALLLLALAAGCRPSVVHVDHGLRAESSADADHVRALGERLGVPVEVVRVEVAPGPNLEARARTARHAVLPAGALLGHTADDQAETMLINLLRGAGPAGLAGMAADDRRPLLALRRHETVGLCRAHGLAPVDDAMNHDDRFARTRVRDELLPLMSHIAGRDVVPVLVRQAGVFGDLADLVDELAAPLDPTDARALAAARKPVARAAERRWLQAGTGADHPPDLASVDRVLEVAAGGAKAAEVTGAWRVSRHGQRLRLAPIERAPEG